MSTSFRTSLRVLNEAREQLRTTDVLLPCDEEVARLSLIQLCVEIAGDYGMEVNASGEIRPDVPWFNEAVRRLQADVPASNRANCV